MTRLWTPDDERAPRILTRDAAAGLGYSPAAVAHLVSTGRWRRVLPHTYLTSDTLTRLDRHCAAVAFAGNGALLSGPAALDGLGLRSAPPAQTVLVLVPPGRQPRSVAWVRVRPSARPVTRAPRPGPACAEAARAVADTALALRYRDDVRALVAEAVRRRHCTVEELAAELRAGPQRGSALFRQAIDEVGDGAWSAPEARAATLMRGAGLPPFEQNVAIALPGGGWYVADFLWEALRAVLEIDSDSHHFLTGDEDGTSDRHLALESLDYSVVHRRPRMVIRTPGLFLDGITRWLAGRMAALHRRAAC